MLFGTYAAGAAGHPGAPEAVGPAAAGPAGDPRRGTPLQLPPRPQPYARPQARRPARVPVGSRRHASTVISPGTLAAQRGATHRSPIRKSGVHFCVHELRRGSERHECTRVDSCCCSCASRKGSKRGEYIRSATAATRRVMIVSPLRVPYGVVA
eukprot:1194618-Prorocentrum_minimum.AAC.2